MPGSCLAIRSIRHGSIMQPPTTCDRHLAIARESDWFRAKPTLIRPSSDSIDDEIRTSAKSPGRPVPRSPRSGGRWRSSNSTGHAGPRRSSVSITGIRPAGPSRAGQEIQLGPCLSSLLRMELEILGGDFWSEVGKAFAALLVRGLARAVGGGLGSRAGPCRAAVVGPRAVGGCVSGSVWDALRDGNMLRGCVIGMVLL